MNRSVNSPTVIVGSDADELFLALPVYVVVAVAVALLSVN
jgi:hypothetical protein